MFTDPSVDDFPVVDISIVGPTGYTVYGTNINFRAPFSTTYTGYVGDVGSSALISAPSISKTSIAVGTDIAGPTGTIRISNNGGYSWRSATGGFTRSGYGIVKKGNRWVAVGSDDDPTLGTVGRILISDNNGATWRPSSNNVFNVFGGAISASKFDNSWVAVGGLDNSIAMSIDGDTWTGATGGFSGGGNGVVSIFTDKWAAVGYDSAGPMGTIRYSTDNGLSWTGASGGFDLAGNGIATNGFRTVAVGLGSNTILISDDEGVTWTPASDSFSQFGIAVAYGNSKWVAVGDNQPNGTILVSTDGDTWTGATGGFSVYGNSVSWNGTNWIAVGQDVGGPTGTIRTSTDGFTWNSATGGFSVDGNSVSSANEYPSKNVQIDIVPSNAEAFTIENPHREFIIQASQINFTNTAFKNIAIRSVALQNFPLFPSGIEVINISTASFGSNNFPDISMYSQLRTFSLNSVGLTLALIPSSLPTSLRYLSLEDNFISVDRANAFIDILPALPSGSTGQLYIKYQQGYAIAPTATKAGWTIS